MPSFFKRSRRIKNRKRTNPNKSIQIESLENRQLMAADLSFDAQLVPQREGREDALVAIGKDFGGGLQLKDRAPRGTDGDLHEVDVAYIGGSPATTGALLVSAAGTGSEIQLSSWRATNGNPSPVHLHDAPTFSGFDADIHPLTPQTQLANSRDTFIASRIGTSGDLWLTSQTINAAGAFTAHSTRGFGSNINFKVLDHAITHAPASNGESSTQVITPVIGENSEGDLELRVVSWRVSHNSNDVQGLKFSDPLDVSYLPADGGGLSIHHSTAGIFEINFKDTSDRLVTRYIAVTDDGLILDAGGGNSGKSFRGTNNSYYGDEFATVRLNSQSFIAVNQQDESIEATVWERRVEGCFFFLCSFEPYELGNSENDERSTLPGISFDEPNLTHAYGTSPGTREYFGSSIVAADFNGDGFKDLAVGAPGQKVNGNENAGAVTILYGGESGLYNSPLTRTIHQDTPGLNGVADEGDLFGFSLAAGDFNGDGKDDLAIGAPGESIEAENLTESGVVHILYGTSEGLSMSTDQIFRQGADGAEGISESGDQFAWSLAAGDFNGDGRDDVAVGIPFEDHLQGGYVDGGAVHVFYGSHQGIRTTDDVTFHQNSNGMLGSTASGDEYGYSLATGDIDNDGRDDLAIGIPGKTFFGFDDAGAVHIVMGTAGGLGTEDQLISQDGIDNNNGGSGGDISDGTETGDRFGHAVALGDFNGDGFDDLAVSAPEEDHSGFVNAGRVHVLQGSASGITNANEKMFDQDSPGVATSAETGGRFGHSLAAGEVHGDSKDDLLIGVPYQDRQVGNVTYANTGIAILLNGTGSGISGFGSKAIQQGVNGIDGEGNPGDHFGEAVPLADMNNDGKDDAVIGVPNEMVTKLSSEYDFAGQVQIVFADDSGSGLSSSDTVWVQGDTKHIRAKLADSGWEQQYVVGNGELYELMPEGEILPEHAASVTKTMTLLLASEALDMPNSPISLSDVVTISEKAGTTGGSKMTGTLDGEEALLEPGDQITLEALLYGMMIHSGNRASVAIAEHIGINVYGADASDEDAPFNAFVDHMNTRAEAIPLPATRYGHPAGGSTTTPQDLITFWREAWKNSTFRTYAAADAAYPNNPATTVNTDEPKEFTLSRTKSYVGHDGWKGGHGKVGDVFDKNGNEISAPICDQCHVGSATRGGHTLIVGIQQSKEDMYNAEQLYDFGFKKLFTPDLRGTSDFQSKGGGGIVIAPGTPVMGDLRAIALDHITGNAIVSASVDGNQHLQIRIWNANVGSGQIDVIGGTIVSVEDLAPAVGDVKRDTVIDAVEMPSSGKILGDYVSGMISGGNLRLDAWRVGADYVKPAEFVPIDVIGDFTGDRAVNELDIERLGVEINSRTPNLEFDLNHDQKVDREDLAQLIDDVMGSTIGDSNLDGRFDSGDLVQVFKAGKYEDGVRNNATWAEGDWNQDGDFDSGDLVFAFTRGSYLARAQSERDVAASVDALLAMESDLHDDDLTVNGRRAVI
ncbi:MAG: FG-GAP repeat protein [Planctomycetales bacterium]|nr:FG-GAP repeat protein [Planctomycetales bacterium]